MAATQINWDDEGELLTDLEDIMKVKQYRTRMDALRFIIRDARKNLKDE